jgi:hypothetical protein
VKQLAIGIALLLVVSGVLAQTCAKPGAVLSAKNKVVVRSSPPADRFLFLVSPPGAAVAELPAGAVVTVKDSEVIPALMRKDVWVNITAQSGISGWIYCGSTSEFKNFKPLR